MMQHFLKDRMIISCHNQTKNRMFGSYEQTSHDRISGMQLNRFGSMPKQNKTDKLFLRAHSFSVIYAQKCAYFSFTEFFITHFYYFTSLLQFIYGFQILTIFY